MTETMIYFFLFTIGFILSIIWRKHQKNIEDRNRLISDTRLFWNQAKLMGIESSYYDPNLQIYLEEMNKNNKISFYYVYENILKPLNMFVEKIRLNRVEVFLKPYEKLYPYMSDEDVRELWKRYYDIERRWRKITKN